MWSDELLALELAELSEAGYDPFMTGLEDDELAMMLADLGDGGAQAPDEDAPNEEDEDVPEPP